MRPTYDLYNSETIPEFEELLEDLTDDEVQKMGQYLTEEEYVSGETIFYEGEDGGRFYIVREGEVEICEMSGKAGDEYKILALLGEGDIFGELSFFLDDDYSASSVAASYCKLFVLESSQFAKMQEEVPEAAGKIYEALCMIMASRLRLVMSED